MTYNLISTNPKNRNPLPTVIASFATKAEALAAFKALPNKLNMGVMAAPTKLVARDLSVAEIFAAEEWID